MSPLKLHLVIYFLVNVQLGALCERNGSDGKFPFVIFLPSRFQGRTLGMSSLKSVFFNQHNKTFTELNHIPCLMRGVGNYVPWSNWCSKRFPCSVHEGFNSRRHLECQRQGMLPNHCAARKNLQHILLKPAEKL